MLHLDHAYQALILHLQTMQKISMLSCRCIICQNIETSGTLCNYYRDEVIDDENKNNNDGSYKK